MRFIVIYLDIKKEQILTSCLRLHTFFGHNFIVSSRTEIKSYTSSCCLITMHIFWTISEVLVPFDFLRTGPEGLWDTVGFEDSFLTTNRYMRIYEKFAGAFHWVSKTETTKQLR